MKLPWFAIALISLVIGMALGAVLVLEFCGPDKAYWVKRAKYDADVAVKDASLKDALAVIADKDRIVAEKDNNLAAKDAKIAALNAQARTDAQETAQAKSETARLKADAQAVIDANPAVRALVENFELRCDGYEKQIFTLIAVIDEERSAKGDWIAKHNAVIVQRDTWRNQYDEEHALRLTSDALRVGLEKKFYGGKFWRAVAIAEPIVFTAIAIFGKATK